jgi:hypothetical protein
MKLFIGSRYSLEFHKEAYVAHLHHARCSCLVSGSMASQVVGHLADGDSYGDMDAEIAL